MNKLALLAGIAALAIPAVAHATTPPPPPPSNGGYEQIPGPQYPGRINERTYIDIEYDNKLNASIDATVKYEKNLRLDGGAKVKGDIVVDSSAVAISDPKQVVEANVIVDFGTNSANLGSVGGKDGASGNIGVNVAAGYANAQANIATIASNVDTKRRERDEANRSSCSNGGCGDDDDDRKGSGWAEATTISLQKVLGNFMGGSGNNKANVGSVYGSGNIGVNVAAGAFNAQENVLTMAVVKDSVLAEANTGNLQLVAYNTVLECKVNNDANVGSVGGTGNIGVNVAAGAGNVQSNTLTIATTIR